ncbi:hypothetical protein TSMEX_009008 [Taenia solium]|eukprot:TsM_001064400 transcript=TsM_001064400 gene=TsM_001064400
MYELCRYFASRCRGIDFISEELEVNEESATLVAAPADLPLKEGMNLEDWLKLAKFNLHLYPMRQRVPPTFRALSQALFSTVIDVGIPHDSDIDQSWDTLAHLPIGKQERTLARSSFYYYEKPGKDDEEYARNLQRITVRAFRGSPSIIVANWEAVQFRDGVQSPNIVRKIYAIMANKLSQQVEFATGKRQELCLTSPFQTFNRWPNPTSPERLPLDTIQEQASRPFRYPVYFKMPSSHLCESQTSYKLSQTFAARFGLFCLIRDFVHQKEGRR